MTVGLVLVSHSRDLAAGLAELAGQMASGVRIAAAGGTDDGGIGTSFDRVTAAIAEADGGGGGGDGGDGGGVVVLFDIGSAKLTADTALEFLDEEQAQRVRLVDAPFVEAAVSAAVRAATGGSLDDVVAAAEEACDLWRSRGAVGLEQAAALVREDRDSR